MPPKSPSLSTSSLIISSIPPIVSSTKDIKDIIASIESIVKRRAASPFDPALTKIRAIMLINNHKNTLGSVIVSSLIVLDDKNIDDDFIDNAVNSAKNKVEEIKKDLK